MLLAFGAEDALDGATFLGAPLPGGAARLADARLFPALGESDTQSRSLQPSGSLKRSARWTLESRAHDVIGRTLNNRCVVSYYVTT